MGMAKEGNRAKKSRGQREERCIKGKEKGRG
jgi:hypothetical protein